MKKRFVTKKVKSLKSAQGSYSNYKPGSIYISGYERVRIKSEELMDVHWGLVICDEGCDSPIDFSIFILMNVIFKAYHFWKFC